MDGAAEDTVEVARRLPYRRYWMSLYRREVRAAEDIVEHCLEHWPPQRLYMRLFEPALHLSGILFARGEITFQDEHFVTYHTQRLMRRARHRFVPRITTGPLALATATGQRSHVIGLQIVCDFLRSENWRIHYLESADRAVARQAAAELSPSALLISIGISGGIEPARRIVADVRRERFGGVVAVGGLAVKHDPSVVQIVGADITARNGPHLLTRLRQMQASGKGPA